MLATPPSTSCAMRSPASSEQRVRPSGLLCGRLLVALVESVLRPGGWENMCRLMCHCVRHVSLDNKYGRSVKTIHSSRSRWRAGTELCADKQEEPSGKKGSMGSEKRQKSFRCDLKSVVTLLFPPRFDRAAFKIRRYLPERLNFPQAPRQHERRREAASARRVLRAARSNLGGTDRIKADFRTMSVKPIISSTY